MGNRGGSTGSVLMMEGGQQRSSVRAFKGSSAAHRIPWGPHKRANTEATGDDTLVLEITGARAGCEDAHQALLSNQALKWQ